MAPKRAQAATESQPELPLTDTSTSSGIESWELPKSLVTKIAKAAVGGGPEGDSFASLGAVNGSAESSLPTKFTKDATLSLVKGSTVFINYVAATAHDIALSRSHKTISAADVIKALEQLEFGDIAAILPGELEAYRAAEKAKKTAPAGGSKKGKEKEKETTEKITLTIPGGQKKAQTSSASNMVSNSSTVPLTNQTPSQASSSMALLEGGQSLQTESLTIEDEDTGMHDDVDVDVDDGGDGHDEGEGGNEMDIDADEGDDEGVDEGEGDEGA